MIRAIRNFWIDAQIDGRETVLSGGPKCKTGGINLTIKQRDNKGIVTAATIIGVADKDGNLRLSISDKNGETIYQLNTNR